MNSRDRVLAALCFEETDRIPIYDTIWEATVSRWKSEGLPTDISASEYFDFDMVWFGADTSPLFEVETMEETEEYIIEHTPFGGIRRNHKDLSGTPEIIDYACKTRADWEKIKDRLTPGPHRVDWQGTWAYGWDAASENSPPDSISIRGKQEFRSGLPGNQIAYKQEKFLCYFAVVGFDKVMNYIKTDQALIAVATDPDWLMDMYQVDTDLVVNMCELMRNGGFHFDAAFLCCDLGYRSGTFFSPHHYKTQLHSTMKRLIDYFHGANMKVILHSCGQVHSLIPFFVEAGLDCLQPLEVKAGMDLVALKQQWHKKIAFMGGIDVRTMADPNPSIIEDEISNKLPVAKLGGGYIYHSDHSVPNDVSFRQYQHVQELVRKYGAY